MTEGIRFSSTHGENIKLSNSSTTASWSARCPSGWAFSAVPLEAGQTVVVTLDGSGHCDLGYIRQDPESVNVSRQPLTFKHLNEIRIHKKKCTIPISLNKKGKEVSSRYQDKTFNKEIEQGTQLWLAILIKFGGISSKFLLNGSTDNPIRFSTNHGANITLDENNSLAKTRQANPAAICFVEKRLELGEEMVFECSPLNDSNNEPRRYHVKLQIHDKNPDYLKEEFKFLFDPKYPLNGQPPLTTLEMLEKEECRGQIVVTLVSDTQVGYRAASSKYNEQRLKGRVSGGIWIVFELFRATITASKRRKSSACQQNLPDSVCREPSNEMAENSMDVFPSVQSNTELKQAYAGYVAVSEVRTDGVGKGENLKDRLDSLEQGQRQLQENVALLSQTILYKRSLVQDPEPTDNQCHFPNAIPTSPVQQIQGGFPLGQDRRINSRPNFTQLLRDLHCDPVCDKLYEMELITSADYNEIRAEKNPTDKTRTLLSKMDKRNIRKSQMDRILDETEQGFLKGLF